MKKYFQPYFLFVIFFICCNSDRSHKDETKKPTRKQNAAVTNIKANKIVIDDPKLASLVYRTDYLLGVLEKLNPSSNQSFRVKDFTFTPDDVRFMKDSVKNNDTGFSLNGENDINTFTSIMVNLVENNLKQILTWNKIDKYDLKNLFTQIIPISSPDNKLFVFSFDEQTGGSYHSKRTLVHYKDGTGRGFNSFDTGGAAFASDGYYQIDTINTKNDRFYLLMGALYTCETCVDHYLSLLRIEKGKFVFPFSYYVSCRSGTSDVPDDDVIDYDASKHYIKVKYRTSDLHSTCDCNHQNQNISSSDLDTITVAEKELPNGTLCHFFYVFNGQYFEIKQSRI